jgi:zinc transporter ZupT
MNPYTYIILFASVIIGAVFVNFFKPQKDRMKLLISFSGAYLFAITVLHLIPEIYHTHSDVSVGTFILIGFFLQIVLEHFSQGIEHGHAHFHGSLPLSMLIGLCVHAFMEGMPLATCFHHHHDTQNALLAGIALHKVPVSIVLFSMFLHSGMKKGKAFFLLVLFALMTPLGTFAAEYIGELSNYFVEINAIVVGVFLHISTTILFESSEGHSFNRQKMIAIVLGAGIALLGNSL